VVLGLKGCRRLCDALGKSGFRVLGYRKLRCPGKGWRAL
jgi:hypothetical protein